MIARVKIAPVDKWCSFYRHLLAEDPERIVGLEVEINTASMKMTCGHYLSKEDEIEHEGVPSWQLTLESCNSLRAAFGWSPNYMNIWICAHQLEMD